MCNETIPFLLLLAAPIAYFAYRFGLLEQPAVRFAIGALVLGILVFRPPAGGLDPELLGRVKLLLAVLAVAFVATMSAGEADPAALRRRRFALAILAAASALTYLNFLSFHGRGVFVHAHDLGHYYLGSKYFSEIGYGELYAAVVEADAETNRGTPSVTTARDLASNRTVPVAELRARGREIRERFSPGRWQAFRADVALLRAKMGERFAALVQDHGYNPTPVWALIGGFVANLVPAGSERGLVALALVDPALQAAAIGSLAWAFGVDVALLAVVYLGILFGASFDWVGGSFLRQMWFAATVVSLSLLHRGAGVTAGALLAFAATLRVFPAFFAVGIAAHVGLAAIRRRALDATEIRFLGGFAAGGVVLVEATMFGHRGLADWMSFRQNLDAHVSGLMSNFVGGATWVRYLEAFLTGSADPMAALLGEGGALASVAIAVLSAGALLVAVLLADGAEDRVARFALGIWPIVFALKLSAYYSTFLVVLLVAVRRDPKRLALLFAAEAMLHALALFERHFVMLCLFRSLLMTYLLVALHLDELRRAWEAWRPRRGVREVAHG